MERTGVRDGKKIVGQDNRRGQSEQESQDRTEMTGRSEEDTMDNTAVTGKP
jgi:hypothetical protein